MSYKNFLIKSLFNKQMSGVELLEKYYEECEQDVDNKRRYYISLDNEKTEKELKTQIRAEIQSHFTRKTLKKYFNITKKEKSLYQYSLSVLRGYPS